MGIDSKDRGRVAEYSVVFAEAIQRRRRRQQVGRRKKEGKRLHLTRSREGMHGLFYHRRQAAMINLIWGHTPHLDD